WLPTDDSLDRQVSAQAERAMGDADVILFVVDASIGATEEDARVAGLLRRSDKPLLIVSKKIASVCREADASAPTRLGLGDPRDRSASSTPPACGARAASVRAPSTTRSCERCRPSTDPTRRSSSSTPARA